MLGACTNKDDSSARQLSDYKDLTTADSLMYYFGQLRAVDYWQYAYSDTTRRSKESRDEYMRGVKAGLDAVRQSEAYNEGLYVGIQLAMNLKQFEKEYEVTPNKKILVNAIEDGLKNDSIVNPGIANSEFRQILDRLNQQKEEKSRQVGVDALAAEAKSQKWQKVADNLYVGKREGGSGENYKAGQTVATDIEIRTLDGKDLDRRNTTDITVGQAYPGPITDAILTMKEGETATFYTYALAIFGRYYERMNVKPDEVIMVKITTGKATDPAPADSIPASK